MLRLAVANFRVGFVRFALAIAAVAMAVALVVSITSGFASLDRLVRGFVMSFMGTIDFEISRPDDAVPRIEPELLEALRSDPRIRSAHARVTTAVLPLSDDNKPWSDAVPVTLFGIDPATDPIVKLLEPVSGTWFGSDNGDEIVLDSNTASWMNAKVGQVVRFPPGDDPLTLRVIGIVDMPAAVGGWFRSAFSPIRRVQEHVTPGGPPRYDLLRGEFHPEVDQRAFFDHWREKIAAIDAAYVMRSKRETREKLDKNLRSMTASSYWASTVGMLAAAFIVLSTMSMGVAERQRQLAMLRAIGATRRQVGVMVMWEGSFTSLVGALLGVPLGLAFVHVLELVFPELFSQGVAISVEGIVFAVVAAVITAMLASVVPAWQAGRSRPLEAMASRVKPSDGRPPWKLFAAGLVLASLDSIVVFAPIGGLLGGIGIDLPQNREGDLLLALRFTIGLPMLMVGFLLIAPMAVYVAERVLGPIVARLIGVRFELLNQQLSGAIWRAAGTAASLMVGLAMLVVMNMQGRSALASWRIPDRFPDTFLMLEHGLGTLSEARLRELINLPGVIDDQVMPMRITVPSLGDSTLALASWIAMPEGTMFIGMEPRLFFDMLSLDFRDGDAATARRIMTGGRRLALADGRVVHATIEDVGGRRRLHTLDGQQLTVGPEQIESEEAGRYLLVTNEFMRLRNLGVGDTIALESGLLFKRRFEYTIAGVVWSPGMDVLLNAYDLPNRVQNQSVYAVFGSNADAARDFGARDYRLIAANVDPGLNRKQLMQELSTALRGRGVNLIDVRRFRDELVGTFNNLLNFATTVAWAAMLVASLGICNTIIAGVRTRRWQIGVLRSVGVTRGQLLRLILAEAVLLGVAGCVLGVSAGLLMAVNANQFYANLIGFDPPLVVPWDVIGIACAVVMVLALLMSAWPAISTAAKSPLVLLQAGRSSS